MTIKTKPSTASVKQHRDLLHGYLFVMPGLGTKKKDYVSRPDRSIGDLPQLSNEMQLSIMNRVKNGEISIEDALNQARKEREHLRQEQPEKSTTQQYNFSVHKHGRYRWQKRVLQIDFKTKLLCSIERGIVKRQLPFSIVKSCDDGVGSRFSISFKEHHDYELEATSLEDKHKMMQLVNQIIHGNIYSDSESENSESQQEPQASQSLKEGVLLLHRGGLASFKWVKYKAQLHPGELTLVPFRQRSNIDRDVTSSVPLSTVIHLSDGDTSVQKPYGYDTFILLTHRNEYQFKIPAQEEAVSPGAVQKERDAWVKAIHKLCSHWKRKSRSEQMFAESKSLQHISIPEDFDDNDTDLECGGGFAAEDLVPEDDKNSDSTSGDRECTLPEEEGPSSPSADTKPVPRPRIGKAAIQVTAGSDNLSPLSSPTSLYATVSKLPLSPPHSPCHAGLMSFPSGPESQKPASPDVKQPPTPFIPPPPPLPVKQSTLKKSRTKAFHWDLVGHEKITKTFWVQEKSKKPEIDTSRLLEQFAVKDLGSFGTTDSSSTQHIMLNQKIAHNFNIFLKSFPVQPGELKDKLFIINEEDGGLSDEHITSLRRYVPTLEDVEMYKSHKGPVSELHIVDRYMMEMCNVSYLSTQLDLLLTLRELPISMKDLQPLINQKIRMCKQLYNSRSFVSVLEYLLAIGNYLNENAGKEKAKGFRLSSLTKLSQLRGRDKNFTLLHALLEQIMLQEPGLATFTQDLAEFETVPGASIKGLTAEVDVLKNEVQKVLQYRKTIKKRNIAAQHPNFTKDLKMAIEKYNVQLESLTKTCEEMKKLYSVILVKFGEPLDQDSQELFGMICQFLHDFQRVHAETA
ncbi:formin-like protein 13 [Xiphophorus maculatus]|uniref:Formin-like protein 13 n=1 Tax=Xiphophorus maculatus TaxID=8083 RepID=A0A3B5RCC7_XIPMA|nr:formin-like protein 13 [Xiphophorus maculatus]